MTSCWTTAKADVVLEPSSGKLIDCEASRTMVMAGQRSPKTFSLIWAWETTLMSK